MDSFNYKDSAARTSLVEIKTDHLKTDNDGVQRATGRLYLIGRRLELSAAQRLITRAAEQEGLDVRIYSEGKQTKSPHLEITLRDDPEDGPIKLLSLVHRATHCDIGATVVAEIGAETVKPDFTGGRTREEIYPCVTVSVNQPEDTELRETVIQYLRDRLNALSKAEPFRSYATDSYGNGDITLFTQTKDWGEPESIRTARLRARGLAEHVSGMLGLKEHIARN